MLKQHAQIGDQIQTTSKFKLGDKKKGIIWTIPNEGGFGIKFDDEFRGLHYLDQKLVEKKGFYLKRTEFTILKSTVKKEYKTEEEQKFLQKMRENQMKQFTKLPQEFFQQIYYSEDSVRQIRSLKSDIKRNEQSIKNYEERAKELKKKIIKMNPDFTQADAIYHKLKQNKLIKELHIKEGYYIILTNELTYHSIHNPVMFPDYKLGGYAIFLDINGGSNPQIFNYTRHFMGGAYQHPCIQSTGGPCWGSPVANEVRNLRQHDKIAEAIFIILRFLQQPDEITPFIDTALFSCSQKIDKEPKDIMQYKMSSFYQSLKWDNKKFLKDRKKAKEIAGQRQLRNDNNNEDNEDNN